jgi:hypothetical protein
MNFLITAQGIKIRTFISDRHTSVSSYMNTTLKDVTHYFDLWHIKKSEYLIVY